MRTRLTPAALLGGLLVACAPLLAHGQKDEAPADKAVIVVKLPADAKLTIDGDPTKATGAKRRFVTPALETGQTYTYTLAATWTEDGKEQKASEKVAFEAGQVVVVDFARTSVRLVFAKPRPGAKVHFSIDGDRFTFTSDKKLIGGKGKGVWKGDKLYYTTRPLEVGKEYICPAEVEFNNALSTPSVRVKAKRGDVEVEIEAAKGRC